MALTEYNKKRNFRRTPEPKGVRASSGKALFVIQKHDASHLHYDFRLEIDGTLKSWAVPKGPSLDPEVRRLAMAVEDHPLSYRDFEGTIPKGNYGAGNVIVWDTGTFETEEPAKKLYEKGHLSFTLHGKKLKGAFSLVRTQRSKQWLLIKKNDEFASEEDVLDDTSSALSKRSLIGRKEIRAKKKSVGKKAKKTSISSQDLKPMLATLGTDAFDDPDWIFEVKWDGYRIITHKAEGEVVLYSRNGNVVTTDYPALAEAAEILPDNTVIDGELIALDEEGRPSFQLMQHARTVPKTRLAYYAFDVLFYDGRDVREATLLDRKEILKALIPKRSIIKYSEHVAGSGIEYFEAAKEQRLEGVMAKRAASTYRSGARSDDWLKIKTSMRQEVVIIGYTDPKRSRAHFGSLLLGIYKGKKLVYAGRAGTGFGGGLLKDVFNQMQKLSTEKKPIPDHVPDEKSTHWIKPKLVCEVKFTEWTEDGHMRHPVFMGLRDDKKPAEVSRERPATSVQSKDPSEGPKLTHLDKIFWPEDGYTKGDAIEYYRAMADTILPYLKDRPESMLRHPNGITQQGFFQKNVEPDSVPEFADTETVFSESNNANIHYLICNNVETLLYMANLGCIEINPWLSHIGSLDKPDWYVIDLDPGDNTFEQVVEVAKVVHQILEEACEKSYVKTSGKTGMHICIPLGARYTYEQIQPFAKMVAELVHARLPELTSIERSPAKRKRKIYIDFLQNRKGQTIAAPYSIRPVEGATVSTPLEWSEVKKGLDPRKFTIKTIFKRLKKKGDLWESILKESVDLNASITCIQKALEKHQK